MSSINNSINFIMLDINCSFITNLDLILLNLISIRCSFNIIQF